MEIHKIGAIFGRLPAVKWHICYRIPGFKTVIFFTLWIIKTKANFPSPTWQRNFHVITVIIILNHFLFTRRIYKIRIPLIMQAHHSIIRGSFSADAMSLKNKKNGKRQLIQFLFYINWHLCLNTLKNYRNNFDLWLTVS